MSFHRVTYVVAPVGTQFCERVVRPVIRRDRTMHDYFSAGEISVRRETKERLFVLRGQDRLVSLDLDTQRRAAPSAPARERMSGEQTRRHASALLSSLDAAREGHEEGRPRTASPPFTARR
jgi:hypothetical protein